MHFGIRSYFYSAQVELHILFTGIIPGDQKTEGKLDPDGFPPIGTLLQEGNPYYWYVR